MTDLLWILVGSLCPKCVEDGSSGGQEGADADHDQRDNARVAVASAVRHVDFFRTRRTERNFPECKPQQDMLFGRMQLPHSKKYIYFFFL